MVSRRRSLVSLLTISRLGAYTVAVALLFLLLVVIHAGSARKELIQWLPLFIISWSLATVAIYKALGYHSPHQGAVVEGAELSRVVIDSSSDHSFRTLSDQQSHPTPSESNRLNPLYFAHHGPSSRCSRRTESGDSDVSISLSGVGGRPQPHWDLRTATFFPGENIGPETDSSGEDHGRINRERDMSLDLMSEATFGSSHPFLGRNRASGP
jgi:hypothetical protein